MQLKKAFLIWGVVTVLVLVVYALVVPSIPQPKPMGDFKATKSQTLYFKNLRAYFYEKEEMPEAGFTVYRLEKYLESEDLHFGPILIHNWRNEEIYLLFESKRDRKTVTELYVDIEGVTSLHSSELSTQSHLKVAYDLLPFLYEDRVILMNQEKLKPEHKAVFKTVIKDYVKWVSKGR